MISKIIPDLLSCPTHISGILAPKKVVEEDKNKKNFHPSCMIDFMHTCWDQYETQVWNIYGKLKGLYPYIYKEETYILLSLQISHQWNLWRIWVLPRTGEGYAPLNSFGGKFNAEDSKNSDNPSDKFEQHFAFSHSSIILDRNLEANLWLFCLFKCQWLWYSAPSMKKLYVRKNQPVYAVSLLMMFPISIVLLLFILPISQISWRRCNG